MIESEIEDDVKSEFTDELTDEALDRGETFENSVKPVRCVGCR
jgi:hypothetical protein